MTDNEVWTAKLDNVWTVRVVREADYAGILTVTHDDGREILKENVPLSYAAAFGPDVDDVSDWQNKAVAAVDAQ